MQYVQDTLFPDTDLIGSGQLRPWPAVEDEPETESAPVQAEMLPVGEEPTP